MLNAAKKGLFLDFLDQIFGHFTNQNFGTASFNPVNEELTAVALIPRPLKHFEHAVHQPLQREELLLRVGVQDFR